MSELATPRSRALSVRAFVLLALLAAVSGCTRVPKAPDPSTRDIARALSDKTLTHSSGARIHMGRDGTIEGSGLSGSWWVSGKSVCRTLVAPTTMIGTSCQKVHFTDTHVAFATPNGPIQSFRIED